MKLLKTIFSILCGVVLLPLALVAAVCYVIYRPIEILYRYLIANVIY